MEPVSDSFRKIVANSKGIARLLLTIGENRLELLTVEMQEGLERLVRLILLALGVAVLGLLAGITLTAALVFVLKAYSPMYVLLSLAGLYTAAGIFMYWRLSKLLRNWQLLSASLDQIRKDRVCQEDIK